ncbi:MAG: transposase [Schwartzia sp.]|nr:transposase [Schwartzia sp. (in: firmicutes)]
MGVYSVPEEIRKMKPKGTMVKRIKDKFYVYQYSTSKIKIAAEDGSSHWKTKTIMGKCIGSIKPECGFVPNEAKLADDVITVKNYGDYAFAISAAKGVSDLLHLAFHPEDAEQIFVAATILFVDGFTVMKDMKGKYDMSYLSTRFPKANVGQKALHTLYQNLGSRQEGVRRFGQAMLDKSSKRIAIDGHVIACTSEQNDLSEFGYKAAKLGTMQINWMTAYDVVKRAPLLSQICNGSEPDSISVGALLDRYRFTNTQFLADRGFNTAADKERMSGNGNTFIVPMIQNRKDYGYALGHLHFDKRRYFIHGKGKQASMVYYQDIRQDGHRYVAYRDMVRESMDRQAYVRAMTSGESGYTQENLPANERLFGLFLLETNDFDASAETIFSRYKERWAIETYYNYVRNSQDFRALYQQDYFCLQGLGFLMNVAGIIYHEVKRRVTEAGMGVKDVMSMVKRLKMSYEDDRWVIRNATKNVRNLCQKLGFEIPSCVKSGVTT